MTNNNPIFDKAQPKAIKSIAELITQTHALNVFEIMVIAAVTAYGKSRNALQRTTKLGNNQRYDLLGCIHRYIHLSTNCS